MSLRFSVVVPVLNNSAGIKKCVESLKALDFPRDNYEIIVVDTNSSDDSASVAASLGVICLSEKQFQSSCAARNAGILAAQGDLIAFTDSDCCVDRNWLKEMDKASSDSSVGCFAGEIMSAAPATIVERFSDQTGLLRQKDALSGWHFRPFARTANAVYRREVFDAIGLFDPTVNYGGDALLAWRMQDKTDFGIRFVPEAAVYHRHRTNVGDLYSQFRHYGEGKMGWAIAYPDYCPPAIDDLEKDVIALFTRHMEALDAIDASDEILFSGLQAISQAAHLSGYIQDLIRFNSHASKLDMVQENAPKGIPSCDLCGSNDFRPSPNGVSSNGKMPLCAKCGSLERHRILSTTLRCSKEKAAGKLDCLFIGDDFRGASQELGFGDYTDIAQSRNAVVRKKYDVVIIGECLRKQKGELFYNTLNFIVYYLHEDSTLIIVDDVKKFSIDISSIFQNASIYNLRIKDQVTNSAIPLTLLASGITPLIQNFLSGELSVQCLSELA